MTGPYTPKPMDAARSSDDTMAVRDVRIDGLRFGRGEFHGRLLYKSCHVAISAASYSQSASCSLSASPFDADRST